MNTRTLTESEISDHAIPPDCINEILDHLGRLEFFERLELLNQNFRTVFDVSDFRFGGDASILIIHKNLPVKRMGATFGYPIQRVGGKHRGTPIRNFKKGIQVGVVNYE